MAMQQERTRIHDVIARDHPYRLTGRRSRGGAISILRRVKVEVLRLCSSCFCNAIPGPIAGALADDVHFIAVFVHGMRWAKGVGDGQDEIDPGVILGTDNEIAIRGFDTVGVVEHWIVLGVLGGKGRIGFGSGDGPEPWSLVAGHHEDVCRVDGLRGGNVGKGYNVPRIELYDILRDWKSTIRKVAWHLFCCLALTLCLALVMGLALIIGLEVFVILALVLANGDSQCWYI